MATELAKAYVQIIPSAEGISGKLSGLFGAPAGAAGGKAGSTFGSKMVSAASGIIAAAGIGKMLSSAITEGAALQQSMGGIETLFKGSADAVKQNAAEAYRTAGMSANQYMELTTSFAASLLQSLGNDTAKAADTADMAMRDMSDNANKMGTNIEDIKNAYQGFAKQNYTMLDNLKLGYGGTKTEMERLLSDAEKLTGVKYDISNLNDVYSAIHAVQEELDITGTTAKEAASTFSGSFASLSAALKNVLGNLAIGADVAPALQALAETLTTFLVGNLLPMLWDILRALPSALATFIRTAIPQLVTAFLDFIPQLQSGITMSLPQMLNAALLTVGQFATGLMAALPQLMQSGADMLIGLINGIAAAIPQLYTTALSVITQFAMGVVTNLPQLLESGKNVLMSLVSGIQFALPQMLVAAGNAVASLLSGIITHLPEILAAGVDLIVTLVSGLLNALPSIVTAMGQVVRTIWDVIKNTNWIQLGCDIIRGIINGIGSMAQALWDAVINIAKSVLDAFVSFFQIGSPSKLMGDAVGHWLPPGIGVGAEKNTKPMLASMGNVARLAVGTLQQDMSARLAGNRVMDVVGSTQMARGDAATINLYTTVNTHDSLSESEITRELEDFAARSLRRLP